MYALITGSTSGIGKEFTYILAKEKYNLVIVDKYDEKLENQKEELEKKYGIKVKNIMKDLSIESSYNEIYNEVLKDNIEIDLLINNAGFATFPNYINISLKEQRNLIMVNIMAVIQLSYLFGKDMVKRRKGKIANISSISSFIPGPYMSTYYASKAFVQSFTESIYEELKPYNVSVTAICPGPTRTNFEKRAKMEKSYMFRKLKVDNPRFVAEKAYKAIVNNKVVYVVGFYNKMLTFLTRFISLRIRRKLALIINKGDLNTKANI